MSHARLDLAVVIPVFNEQGTIEKIIRAWDRELRRLGVSFEIHVYDDGSFDDTVTAVRSLASNLPNLIGHRWKNLGHGPTTLRGYREHSGRAEWLFQVDSDDEMGPDWFYKLWDIRTHHDFIAGRRYERKSSLSRKLVTLGARIAAHALYGPCIYDVNCPYRLMRSSAFARCFGTIPEDTFAPNILISGFAAHQNLKTVEIHIPHRSRYSGLVSVRKWQLVKCSLLSIYQTIRYRFNGLPRSSAPT